MLGSCLYESTVAICDGDVALVSAEANVRVAVLRGSRRRFPRAALRARADLQDKRLGIRIPESPQPRKPPGYEKAASPATTQAPEINARAAIDIAITAR
jgi:hypothetical protein